MPLNPVPSWPPSLDSLPDPTETTREDDDGFEHDLLHAKVNAILERLQARWGIDVASTTPDVIHKTVKGVSAGASTWGFHSIVKLDEQVGTGASAILAFSSIPSTFRHLELFLVGRSSVAATAAGVRLTLEVTPTAGAYNSQTLSSAAAVVTGGENIGTADFISVCSVPGASSTANVMGAVKVSVFEYANTGIFKTLHADGASATNIASGGLTTLMTLGVWESTAAVSTIRLTLSTGNWTTLSRATLYGIPG